MNDQALNHYRRLSFVGAYLFLQRWIQAEIIDFDPYDVEAETEKFLVESYCDLGTN